jgi:hypothetical protein
MANLRQRRMVSPSWRGKYLTAEKQRLEGRRVMVILWSYIGRTRVEADTIARWDVDILRTPKRLEGGAWRLKIGSWRLEMGSWRLWVETWKRGIVELWNRGTEERNSPSAGENLGLGNTTG